MKEKLYQSVSLFFLLTEKKTKHEMRMKITKEYLTIPIFILKKSPGK